MNLTPAIDFHSHFNSGAAKEQQTSLIYQCDADFLIAERKRLNVVASAVSSFGSVMDHTSVILENEKVGEICDKNESLFQWAVLDPRKEECFSQVERLLDSPRTVGIKIHSPYHGYPIAQYADAIFGFANEFGAAVLMHPDDIKGMVEYADRYTRMKLIIAHLGSLEHIDAIKMAKHGNIYTDTSGIASSKNNVIEYAVNQIGADKIFFGTDTYSVAFQRGRIEFSDISDIDKRKILFENAVGFLRNMGKAETAEKIELLANR